jgi:hypothetical protein
MTIIHAGIDLTQVSHLDKLAEVSGETVLPKMTQWSVQPSYLDVTIHLVLCQK